MCALDGVAASRVVPVVGARRLAVWGQISSPIGPAVYAVPLVALVLSPRRATNAHPSIFPELPSTCTGWSLTLSTAVVYMV